MIKWRAFYLYSLIGILNTLLSALLFFILLKLGMNDAWANALVFIIVVTFSFFTNGRITFQAALNAKLYFSYVIAMALLAFSLGKCTQYLSMSPWWAFFTFAFLSWILGFLLASYLFRQR